MTEAAAKQALQQSVAENRDQMVLTDESRVLLVAQLRAELPAAVADGIREAMTEENARLFVQAVLGEMQRAATMKAGEVAGSAVKAIFGKLIVFMVLGSIVYAWGGWGALASVTKWLATSKAG